MRAAFWTATVRLQWWTQCGLFSCVQTMLQLPVLQIFNYEERRWWKKRKKWVGGKGGCGVQGQMSLRDQPAVPAGSSPCGERRRPCRRFPHRWCEGCSTCTPPCCPTGLKTANHTQCLQHHTSHIGHLQHQQHSSSHPINTSHIRCLHHAPSTPAKLGVYITPHQQVTGFQSHPPFPQSTWPLTQSLSPVYMTADPVPFPNLHDRWPSPFPLSTWSMTQSLSPTYMINDPVPTSTRSLTQSLSPIYMTTDPVPVPNLHDRWPSPFPLSTWLLTQSLSPVYMTADPVPFPCLHDCWPSPFPLSTWLLTQSLSPIYMTADPVPFPCLHDCWPSPFPLSTWPLTQSPWRSRRHASHFGANVIVCRGPLVYCQLMQCLPETQDTHTHHTTSHETQQVWSSHVSDTTQTNNNRVHKTKLFFLMH